MADKNKSTISADDLTVQPVGLNVLVQINRKYDSIVLPVPIATSDIDINIDDFEDVEAYAAIWIAMGDTLVAKVKQQIEDGEIKVG